MAWWIAVILIGSLVGGFWGLRGLTRPPTAHRKIPAEPTQPLLWFSRKPHEKRPIGWLQLILLFLIAALAFAMFIGGMMNAGG